MGFLCLFSSRWVESIECDLKSCVWFYYHIFSLMSNLVPQLASEADFVGCYLWPPGSLARPFRYSLTPPGDSVSPAKLIIQQGTKGARKSVVDLY